MAVTRTVPAKRDVSVGRRDDLHRTIEQYNTAANYTADHGSDNSCLGDFGVEPTVALDDGLDELAEWFHGEREGNSRI